MLRPLLIAVFVWGSASTASTQWLYPGPVLIDFAGNGILEPGETIRVYPSWGNAGPATNCTSGVLGIFTGPAGPTYSIVDGQGDYGCIVDFSPPVFCFPDCYAVRVDAATRPVLHWDATAPETTVGGTQTLRFHVGATFA